MKWSNWTSGVKASPNRFMTVHSEEALSSLVQEVRASGQIIRPVGTGHSFTSLCPSEDVMVSLDGLKGILGREGEVAEIWAGSTLYELGGALSHMGLGMENLGDIDVQTLAGAMNTGTHGTGMGFGNLATQVEGLTLVDGLGQLRTIKKDDEVFKGTVVALGALGIVSRYQLRCQKAFNLAYVSRRASLDDCLLSMDRYVQEHRHFEFYWFPYTDRVQMKFLDESTATANGSQLGKFLNDIFLENGAFWIVSMLCRWLPALSKKVSHLCAALVDEGSRIDESYRLFATRRLVKFEEMEYCIPKSALKEVILEIRKLMEERQFQVHFPLEIRFVKGDDLWLSPAYGRDSAYVAVHMFKGMPFQDYFGAVEQIFLKYEGRPHWGKRHSLKASGLAAKYPRWQDFLALRDEFDPDGVFQSPYLSELLGIGN